MLTPSSPRRLSQLVRIGQSSYGPSEEGSIRGVEGTSVLAATVHRFLIAQISALTSPASLNIRHSAKLVHRRKVAQLLLALRA